MIPCCPTQHSSNSHCDDVTWMPSLGFLRHFPRTKFGLRVDPDARLCVSLGRLVRQKGVDILADVAEWLLSTYPKVDHFFETVKLKGLRD